MPSLWLHEMQRQLVVRPLSIESKSSTMDTDHPRWTLTPIFPLDTVVCGSSFCGNEGGLNIPWFTLHVEREHSSVGRYKQPLLALWLDVCDCSSLSVKSEFHDVEVDVRANRAGASLNIRGGSSSM